MRRLSAHRPNLSVLQPFPKEIRMKWKTTPDGQNVAAAPIEDWLIARIDEMLVLQIRYQTEDERGSALVLDQPFALPVGLAQQLAAQILECARSGMPQEGAPRQTEQ